ncbi:MAG: hypothetical protein JWL70_953 [Acidimicrobiia bacterium]|nr:hypothetical protein [Acidimicrobiia bacterium]
MVYGILIDPEAYPYWVMGTRSVRGWDNEWPAVGTSLHHRAGLGPLAIEDSSKVLVAERDQKFTLEVRIGWLGVGTVEVALEPVGANRATLVTLTETSTGGVFGSIPPPILDPMLHARNALSLRRLARLGKARHQLIQDRPDDVQVGSA